MKNLFIILNDPPYFPQAWEIHNFKLQGMSRFLKNNSVCDQVITDALVTNPAENNWA